MKKICIALIASLALGCGAISAKGHNSDHNPRHDNRPGMVTKPNNPPVAAPGRHPGQPRPLYSGPAHRPTPPPAPRPHRPHHRPVYVDAIPLGSISVNIGGITLFFNNGTYYRPVSAGRFMIWVP